MKVTSGHVSRVRSPRSLAEPDFGILKVEFGPAPDGTMALCSELLDKVISGRTRHRADPDRPEVGTSLGSQQDVASSLR